VVSGIVIHIRELDLVGALVDRISKYIEKKPKQSGQIGIFF